MPGGLYPQASVLGAEPETPYFVQTLTNIKNNFLGVGVRLGKPFFLGHAEDTASTHCELYLDSGEDTLGELQMQRQILEGNFPH